MKSPFSPLHLTPSRCRCEICKVELGLSTNSHPMLTLLVALLQASDETPELTQAGRERATRVYYENCCAFRISERPVLSFKNGNA